MKIFIILNIIPIFIAVIGMAEKSKAVKTIAIIVIIALVAGGIYVMYPKIKAMIYKDEEGGGGGGGSNGTSDTDPVAVIMVNGKKGDAFEFRVGEDIEFNASGSYDEDPGDEIIYYEWSFGDGSVAKNVSYTKNYTRAGDFTVTLKVADRNGGEGTASVNITVKPSDYNQSVSSFVHKGLFLNQFENQSVSFEVLEDAREATIEITMMGLNLNGGPGSAEVDVILIDPEGLTVRQNTTSVMGSASLTYTLEEDELIPGDYTLNLVCQKGTASININISVKY